MSRCVRVVACLLGMAGVAASWGQVGPPLVEPVGTTSAVQTATVTVSVAGTLGSIAVLTQGAAGLDFNFVAGGSCTVGTTYAAGQNCTVEFTFTPTRPGQRYGGIVLNTSAGEVLANGYIYGMGNGPQVGWLPGTQSLLGSGFASPSGVATDGNGNIYVSEYGGGLGEVTAGGVVQSIGTFGITSDVTVDGSGNLIVTGQTEVYEVVAVNGVIPASPTVIPLASGFTLLNGVAVDGAGDVFLANGTGSAPDGAVYEVVAVNGSIPASPTVKTLGSGFGWPTGVAVDAAGDVYTSDAKNKAVYEMVAVNGSVPASPVIRTLGSGFNTPSNVSLDAANDVYLTDSAGSAVDEIEAVNGSVPAMNPTIVTLGTGFSSPQGMEVDSSGNVFFADFGKTQIVKLAYSNTPTLTFATTAVGSTSSDSPQTVTLYNNGNEPLLFAVPGAGTNPSITAGFTIGSGSTCPQLDGASAAASLAPGGACTDLVSFTPVAVGPDSGQLVTTDNALNVTNSMQTVLLNAIASKEPQTITFPAPASPVPFGAPPVTLNATASSGLPVAFSVLSGPGTVSGNVLSFTGYGTVVVAANQAGNATYLAAPQVTQVVVVKDKAAISLSATPNPVFLLNPVTLTASVSAPDGSPGGSVLFLDGSTPIGTAGISGGTATIIVSTLALGPHSIIAVYSGDSLYASITSGVVVVTVEDFAFTLTTPNVTIVHGGTATYTLTLTSIGGANTASAINFSVAGEPDHSVIRFTPPSVAAGSGTTTVTMAIHTPNYPVGPWNGAKIEGVGKASGIMAAFAAAGILLLPFARRRRVLGTRVGWLGCVLLLAVAASLSGCGSGWKTQEWKVNVTASSGQLSHTVSGTLTSECSDGKTACPVEN